VPVVGLVVNLEEELAMVVQLVVVAMVVMAQSLQLRDPLL
jgi:hypothetical protein